MSNAFLTKDELYEVEKSFQKTVKYFAEELENVESAEYDNVYSRLNEFPKKIKNLVEETVKGLTNEQSRFSYLDRVIGSIRNKAAEYDWMQGSVPEDIGKVLERIAKSIDDSRYNF